MTPAEEADYGAGLGRGIPGLVHTEVVRQLGWNLGRPINET